jgi:predicted alpha-1,2-mannosidase
MIFSRLLTHGTKQLAEVVACISLSLLASEAHSETQHLSDSVNTLRGSNSSRDYSHGNTFPAVALPFGFNFWTPVTEGNSTRWLYRYSSQTIQGFGVSHEPSPWIGDHGSLQVMPMTGKLRVTPRARASLFSHFDEIAKPHYYKVTLDTYGITTEFAPTDHASAWRFTFSSSNKAYLLFDSIDSVSGNVAIDRAARTIQGHVDHNGPRLYFFAQVDKEILSFGSSPDSGANGWIELQVHAGDVVNMSMATSFISTDQARANLNAEVGTKTFDQVRQEAQSAWDRTLGKLEIFGATLDQKTTFYSNLYRVFLYPNSMWEKVGQQSKYFSPFTHKEQTGKLYVNSGFWDTYRAVWPLFSLLTPSKAAEMLDGFVTAYKDGGWVPRWSGPGYIDCMVGSHSDIVFADSYLRGVTDFDIRTAYESMLKDALAYSSDPAKGRKGNSRSIFLGYVPSDMMGESASWTLEDAINDFGIAEIARLLGDRVHYEYFLNRSLRYSTLFSPSVGFFRGKRTDGTWRTPDSKFFANEWGYEFAEGSPWNYSVAATADPQGMANLLGGRKALAEKIDSIFRAPRAFRFGSYGQIIHEMREAFATNMGQYAHSNEPVHSIPYIYNYAGAPYKTQFRTREVLDRLYSSGIGSGDGYPGDEDNGQMSAWYIFSALGFYPASPGHPEYAIGSPLFEKGIVNLDNGKQFIISAKNNSRANRYIQSAQLNGMPYSRNYLRHADIAAGGMIEFQMGARPSTWGTATGDLPTSITPIESSKVPQPREDKARGGVITASSENLAEHADRTQAFDDNSLTKWQALEARPTIQYQFAGGKSYTVGLYTVTSAGDTPERDPKDWALQASTDCVTWVTIDKRVNEDFSLRNLTKVYLANNTTPYLCYRLDIGANHGAATTQIAELELIGSDSPQH